MHQETYLSYFDFGKDRKKLQRTISAPIIGPMPFIMEWPEMMLDEEGYEYQRAFWSAPKSCILHKVEHKNTTYGCIYCQWISKGLEEYYRRINQPGERSIWRFDVTLKEFRYRFFGQNCHCGKPKRLWEKNRRKYCSQDCADDWHTKTLHWQQFAYRIAKRDDFICQKCGKKCVTQERGSIYHCGYNIDHKIAIVFGGHCYDEDNVWTLCEDCHKLKTKVDVKILAWWKRESKYDIGALVPEKPQRQLTLELS